MTRPLASGFVGLLGALACAAVALPVSAAAETDAPAPAALPTEAPSASPAPSPPPPPANANEIVIVDPALRPAPRNRRNGVVLGFSFGMGFAGASGYPNNVRLIGDPAAYSQSPMLIGTSTNIFLMGAFTDYVSFGPVLNVATFENDKWRSTGFGIGFRVDVFPLVRLVPALADTAAYAQFGVGSTELQAKGPYPSADGSQSFLGVGVHHEFRLFRMLGGHAAAGPHVEYDVIRSEPAERHWLSVGVRLAWYGGHVQADGAR